jgi:hypothetical protein
VAREVGVILRPRKIVYATADLRVSGRQGMPERMATAPRLASLPTTRE